MGWSFDSLQGLNSLTRLFHASGQSHRPGLVVDPGPTAGTTRFLREDATWAVPGGGGGGGTVTSVAFATNGPFTVTGSPITTAGTINLNLVLESQNTVWAAPSSGPGFPTFRLLVPSDLPGAFAGFANPTAAVGLTPVNGVATTAMRSDAAPPIDTSIFPTWTGQHTWLDNTGTHAPVISIITNAPFNTDSPALFFQAAASDGTSHNPNWQEFVRVASQQGRSFLTWQSRLNQSPAPTPYVTRASISDQGIVSAAQGFQIAETVAMLGHVLRGNGLAFVDGVLAPTDLAGWPANAVGFLHNDGAGNLIWSSPAGGGTVTSISAGTGITLTPNPIVATGTVAVTVQNLLNSTIFGDVLAGSVVRGDVIVGNATPKWSRLGIGANKTYLRSNGTDAAWSTILNTDLPGNFNGFANPTALVGLTVVNGSALTAMRSDAAPPIDQTIAPSWTAVHTWQGPAAAIQLFANGIGSVGMQNSPSISWQGTSLDPTLTAHTSTWSAVVGVANTAGKSQLQWKSQIDSGASPTQFVVTDSGLVSARVGYQINQGAAVLGHFLRGDGNQYVDGTIQVADLPAGTVVGFGNPTAAVRLTAVNGTATTAMRSDAAPPIDVSIFPTWTGQHTWLDNTGTQAPVISLITNAPFNTNSPALFFQAAAADGAGGHNPNWQQFVRVASQQGQSFLTWQSRLNQNPAPTPYVTRASLSDAGIVSAALGYQIAETVAMPGHYLRGNGQAFIDAAATANDDFTQYLLLAGRAGGQSANGGTVTGNSLTFASNPLKDGPITLDSQTFVWTSFTGGTGINKGMLRFNATYTSPTSGNLTTESIFISNTGTYQTTGVTAYHAVLDASAITVSTNLGAVPDFSPYYTNTNFSWTVGGSTNGTVAGFIMNNVVTATNVALTFSNAEAIKGVNFSPVVKATGASGSLTSDVTLYATALSLVTDNAAGVVSVPNFRGLHFIGLGAPGGKSGPGTMTVTTEIALDVDAISDGTNNLALRAGASIIQTTTPASFTVQTGYTAHFVGELAMLTGTECAVLGTGEVLVS